MNPVRFTSGYIKVPSLVGVWQGMDKCAESTTCGILAGSMADSTKMRVQQSTLAGGTWLQMSSLVRSAMKACSRPAACCGCARRMSTAVRLKSHAYAVALLLISSSGRSALPTPQPACA